MRLLSRSGAAYKLRSWQQGSEPARVVIGSGELDLHAAPELRFLLCQMIEMGETHLVVDLTDVTFIDSTIIGVLSGRLRQLSSGGGTVTLVCTNPFLLRTIAIAGMERVFDVHATLPEALARGASR